MRNVAWIIIYYNSSHDTRVTGIKVDAKHSWRFLYSPTPLFVYLRSSLLQYHTYIRAHAHLRLCTPRGFCIPKACLLAECRPTKDTIVWTWL